MQPLKLIIEGDFWDCQIYRGRLYLWTLNGELKVIQWDRLIESLANNQKKRLVLSCAFTKGNYLYGPDLQDIFGDKDVRTLILDKFLQFTPKEIHLSAKQINEFLYGTQDNPFDEIPSDTEIYNNDLYAITDSGLWKVKAHRYSKKHPASSKKEKIWDCPSLSMKANGYGQISISSGDEGLYELDARSDYAFENRIQQLSPKHSMFSNWTHISIYSSSNISKSYMAFYKWKRTEGNYGAFERDFQTIKDEQEVFNSNGSHNMSWGSGDKIYRTRNNELELVRFDNNDAQGNYFSTVEKIKLRPWKGKVIAGGTAYFGAIIECENALVIALSDGTYFTIPGPITRWRVYPRSKNYENHLHVILENRLEIYSFNNDYFADQNEKTLGIKYKIENFRNKRYRSSQKYIFR